MSSLVQLEYLVTYEVFGEKPTHIEAKGNEESYKGGKSLNADQHFNGVDIKNDETKLARNEMIHFVKNLVF